jgi:hypothetical protein
MPAQIKAKRQKSAYSRQQKALLVNNFLNLPKKEQVIKNFALKGLHPNTFGNWVRQLSKSDSDIVPIPSDERKRIRPEKYGQVNEKMVQYLEIRRQL